MMDLMSLHRPFGSLNRLIKHVAIACVTVLIRTSLPTFEISFSFQPVTHFSILSQRSLNVLALFFSSHHWQSQVFLKLRYHLGT